ncbi:response regulator transcription factor [Lujinxingia vulgaris]|uniref:Response regulator transcription factor n=1 Tax=Lujinxingia vulgaris TaxID=2600176 RepID=A0A5C6X2B7_9DELT|nr:LytTR family DNA-binding domain-containing protein [Lujinxingia vulgaris]TXD33579.1 response regulator transcription factor [Lujinxingia vulgaris]
MRALVIDDELPAREELLWLLEQCPQISAAAQAESAKAALARLEAGPPVDVVFLDIDMPGLNGVRLAQLWRDRLGDDAPVFIFVTAYDAHAVDAFALDAADYLLKPVRLSRLQQAIERAERRLHQGAQASASEASETPPSPTAPASSPASTPLTRISVEEHGSYRVIPVDDIIWIEADEGFATVHTATGGYLTDFSLKFLEENLPADHFFRSHRSFIVRLSAISVIAPTGAGTYRLLLSDGTTGVPLARSRAPELKARIPWSANAIEE